MDPELKKELDESLILAKDNNRILHAMQRSHWIGLALKVVFWAALVLVPFYLYQQYLQPIVTRFSPFVNAATATTTSGWFGFPTFADMQKLINSNKAK